MKRKIIKYLKTKEEKDYNNLDKIFVLYLNGNLVKFLNKYGYTKIDIYTQIKKNKDHLQINLLYHNIGIGIDFDDYRYEPIIYDSHRADILFTDDDFTEREYNNDFNIVNLLDEIFDLVIHDDRLDKKEYNDKMKRKIIKYLKTKEENEYSHLDRILKFFLDGNLKETLKKFGFEHIEIFPEIRKKESSIQLYCKYFNFYVICEFTEAYYDYCCYTSKSSIDEIDNSVIRDIYASEFTIDGFIDNFYRQINNDDRLNII